MAKRAKIYKIAVGSKNPVKIEAVRLAFKIVWTDNEYQLEGIDIKSGVSDQPMSDEESIKGARNRAISACQTLNTDFGVGLEGGLQQIGDRWFDCGWVVVVDKQGREGVGSTVKLETPIKMVKMVKGGMELGQADDILFNKQNSKQLEGHFGIMTNNIITRTSGLRDGVLAALARFIQPQVFKE